MIATLKFKLPEEAEEHLNALHGSAWQSVVWDLDHDCRNGLKYGHKFKTVDEVLESMRQRILDIMSDNGLNFSP